MTTFNENTLEQATLGWLAELGWARAFGPEIAPGEPAAERADFSEVILERRLRAALARLNPSLPPEALEDAFRKLTRPSEINLTAANRAFHRMAINGVTVEYSQGGRIIGAQAQVFDFEHPANNDWLAVNQFTIVGSANRRPDVILLVNGLPLAVLELKNSADEHATIWNAFNQLQTYKQQIPALFTYNESLVISDGQNARIGTLTAQKDRFAPWKTIEGAGIDPNHWQLETLVRGVFAPRHFLNLVRHFIVFEDEKNGQPVKKMAAYHQFHAVKVAVDETLRALKENARRARESRAGYRTQNNSLAVAGDGRIGVVWHTQGSGKSLTMAFYAGSIILHPALENPTSSSSPTATTSTTSSSAPSRAVPNSCASPPSRLKAANTCARFCRSPRGESSSPPFKNSRAATRYPTAPTSSSLPMKPIAVNTILWMATPAPCAMPCPTPPSSALPARPSS